MVYISIWAIFGFGSISMVYSTSKSYIYGNIQNVGIKLHENICDALHYFDDHDHPILLLVYRYFTVSILSKLYDRGTPYFAQW